MPQILRRSFLGSGAAALLAAALPRSGRAQARSTLRVQWTNGGHTVPLKYLTIMDDESFRDLDSTLFSFPDPFRTLSTAPGQGPDVVVLCDYSQPWTDKDKESIQKYVEAGKGVVVLHHAVGDNAENWDWWRKNASGSKLIVPDQVGMKTQQRLKQFPIQHLKPIGDHAIVRDVHPFTLPPDEVFPNMGLEPGIIPLISSDDPDLVRPTIAWIGPSPEYRVVCFEAGHTEWVCGDPRYRHIVHNMILWAGKKLA